MWAKWIALFCLITSIMIQGIPIEQSSRHIIFPESDKIVEYVPKCPQNKTFCEEVDNYPETIFYKILRNSLYVEEYFSSPSSLLDIGDRFHPEKEYFICNSRIRTHYPRAACNTKNEWKFVYNFNKYKQGVTTDECIDESPCTSFHGTPKEVRTKCIQKYSDILLLVADQNGEPNWDLFWFPSACVCSYEPIINFNHV